VLLNPAALVLGLGVAHDLARVADSLQIAGDDFVERRSLRAGDLDDTVARGSDATSATIAATSSAAMSWNRTGGSLTMFPSALESAMPPRNSRNWVARLIV